MYVLMYTILYRELEYPQILVSMGHGGRVSWKQSPAAKVKFRGSQKLHVNFRLCGGLASLTPAVFKGQLCIIIY